MALSKHHALVSAILKSNDPFDILGVTKFACKDEVDRCYKYTMSKVHPDKNSHPLATKAAQKVNVSRDILLGGNRKRHVKLDSEIGDIYCDIGEEIRELMDHFKYILYPVIILFVIWMIYLIKLIYADEWSLQKTPLHAFERKTNILRIKYYTLSENSILPPENEVGREYAESVVRSCLQHLATDPWYGILLYYPEDDFCTEGKVMLIYLILFTVSFRYFRNYFYKIKYPQNNVKL